SYDHPGYPRKVAALNAVAVNANPRTTGPKFPSPRANSDIDFVFFVAISPSQPIKIKNRIKPTDKYICSSVMSIVFLLKNIIWIHLFRLNNFQDFIKPLKIYLEPSLNYQLYKSYTRIPEKRIVF